MYKYKPKDYIPQKGDVVVFPHYKGSWIEPTKPYLVIDVKESQVRLEDDRGVKEWFGNITRQIIETLPGTEAKVGDEVIITCKVDYGGYSNNTLNVGDTLTVSQVHDKAGKTHVTYGVPVPGHNTKGRELGIQMKNIKVLQKEKPEPQITDYTVNLTNTSLADRLRLRQVLLDNDQKPVSNALVTELTNRETSYHKIPGIVEWGTSHVASNISIEDFLQKFSKNNKIRNLAFYKKSGKDWTNDEYYNVEKYTQGYSSKIFKLSREEKSNKFLFDIGDRNGTEEFQLQWKEQEGATNFNNCLQVAYEDVFPESTENEEPEKIEEQPMNKPLLSDLLKQYRAYEKFLDNLTVNYDEYKIFTETNSSECISWAFHWEDTPQGDDYWRDLWDSLSETPCINDVRAPDDVDYWRKNYKIINTLYYYNTKSGHVGEICKSWDLPEKHVHFYAEKPTWLQQPDGIPDLSEESVIGASATTDTSETTTQKESIMTDNIEIKINGKEVPTQSVSKPKSDYKLKPAVIADYYSNEGALLSTQRFTGKHALADAQAHLVTLIASHPNAKVVPYTVGKPSKIKHQFQVI